MSAGRSKRTAQLVRAMHVYRNDHAKLLADIQSFLKDYIRVPFAVTNIGFSIGTIDSTLMPVPPTPPQSPRPELDGNASISAICAPDEAGAQPETVNQNILSLNPRDMQIANFPPVHRAAFVFEPEIIINCLNTRIQQRFLDSGIDLYIQFAKTQRGLQPLIKISLFIVGAEAWKAYQEPVTKTSMIAKVSRSFDSHNRKTQLTLASNLLKRSIRFFSFINCVGSDHLFDRALSVNNVVNLKKADLDEFVGTFTRPAFDYLEKLVSQIRHQSQHVRLIRNSMSIAEEFSRAIRMSDSTSDM